GQRLFNTKIALLASTIYLFSPLSILWSVVVKTELPAMVLVSAGMLALLSYFKLENKAYYLLFLAGVLFALGYYVRQSALMMLIASLIFVLYYYKDNVFGAAKTYGVILLGYLSVVLVIFAFFSGFMGFSDTWNSNLNPLDTVSTPLQKVSNLYGGEQPSSSRSEEFRLEDQPWHQSVKEWRRTLEINSLLIFGLILSITYWIYYYRKERNPFSEFKLSYIFVYGWFFSIFIFYLYYSMQRGFFNQYFGEALPPLALITSHVIYSLTTNKEFRKKFNVLVLIILFSFFVSSFDYVISFDGVDSSFSCVWSPQTIGETTSYLKGSNKDAEVMSGAVIWEFESDTKPFLNITHPLSFRSGMNDKQVKEVKDRMFTDPPEYIILDGYTEQTYIRQVPAIKSVMNNSYVLKKEVSGSKYPVKIYELVK
ncbi:MAG: ArnT family glycosyltransferase, partial [Thermoplasmatota archaeon]